MPLRDYLRATVRRTGLAIDRDIEFSVSAYTTLRCSRLAEAAIQVGIQLDQWIRACSARLVRTHGMSPRWLGSVGPFGLAGHRRHSWGRVGAGRARRQGT